MGIVRISGKAISRAIARLIAKFPLNSLAYVKAKAELGVYEVVAIKLQYINVLLEFTYVDTNNRIWLERELLGRDDADAAVTTYKNR